ncbi:DUF1254 domain-containing protein [Pseudomonas sp. URMO17WK12:I11]|uniref:DUF1254 domain-containing protein n=1 Tax=Pseudomonas sp. URMO17WK12:I11 TaxID=1283291 RepID=UPI00071F0190|nr:DUF1254 domain-containing protein [Pseudomonas sp. URMO17WK12:I11]CRL51655.1 hypothetical protein PSHI_48480 [Pseudomonas sp. URMO17WK12:I11]
MKRRELLKFSLLAAALPAFSLKAQESLDGLAREAFVYLYPMVKNYLTLYQYAIERGGSQYKGPVNTLNSVARVYTPEDTGIITPNSDTPYSFLVMDLRTEPLVVTFPKINGERYYSMQLVDLYTHNVGYLGAREDGNGGGDFLIAGPGWQGQIPEGVKRVVRMTTELGLGVIRTQLFSPSDLGEVKQIQAGYKVQPLCAYAGTPAPTPAPAVMWPAILEAKMVTDFWSLAAFLLQFAPALPGDEVLRDQFPKLGLQPGASWPPAGFEGAAQIESAGVFAQQKLAANVLKLKTSVGLFGSPQEMKGRYMERALGAMAGIYGNSVQEALYPTYLVDSDGNPLDTSKKRYAFRFAKDSLPPVGAFWSITMYDGVTRLLVRNELDRYLINSSMLPELKVDGNGDIVIYLQHSSPGKALESNWLPAPAGPMGVVLRLYLPKPSALDGRWTPPVIETLS